MKPLALLLLSLALCLATLVAGRRSMPSHNDTSLPASPSDAPGAVCFAPGTPEEYVSEWQQRIWGDSPVDYWIGERWSYTATDGSTGPQGTPIHLTYSFIPDGVRINGRPNVLYQRMNELFGSEAAWQGRIGLAFQRWAEVCGIQYTQVADDGARFGDSSPGEIGVRGDVRMGMIPIDGESGVLAYNYFPDVGDMVLDADENWASPGQSYIFLRNIVAHEHGHGWGLEHVCPVNNTKLLEPYYTSAFDGPQHDDIRAAQRNYGDRYEPNNTAGEAHSLGTLTSDFLFREIGIDHEPDVDFWKFGIPAGKGVTITLTPWGYPYLDGPQNGDGSCTAGDLINSADDRNLDLYVYNSTGSNLLAQSTSHPAGEAERVFRLNVPAAGDSFIVKVAGDNNDAVQLYQIEFDLYFLDDPYLSISPLDFDTTRLGQPATLVTRLLNPVNSARQITAVSSTGDFSVTPQGAQTLPPQGAIDYSVTFMASQEGLQTGQLTIQHDGPGSVVECPLSGFAATSWLTFVASNDVDFGDVPVGLVDSARVPVRAQGNAPLVIESLVTAPPFSILLSLPYTMYPGQTLFLRPRFQPQQLGEVSGILVINHTGTSSPDTVFLRGVGTPSAAGDLAPSLPHAFRLGQNYPNPFNAMTSIAFDLPKVAHVHLQVFDMEGRLVREFVDAPLSAGHYDVTVDGSSLASGLYLYRLTADDFVGTGKMILLK